MLGSQLQAGATNHKVVLRDRRPNRGEGQMVILNVVFMALIGAAIVGLLVWSVLTQHRDPGCEHLGPRRRLQISVRLVALDVPTPLPIAIDPSLAPEI
jgi:hypothetical protein